MTTNFAMPTLIAGTPMQQTWEKLVALAAEQNIDVATGLVDASAIDLAEIDTLASFGVVEVSVVDGKTMVSLKSAMDPATEMDDVSGAKAAAKPHTFAK